MHGAVFYYYYFGAWQTQSSFTFIIQKKKVSRIFFKNAQNFIFVWAVPLRTVKTLFIVVLIFFSPHSKSCRKGFNTTNYSSSCHYRTKTLGWMWAKRMLSNCSDRKVLWSTRAAWKAHILYELLLICLSFTSLAASPCCGSICPPMVP